MEHFGSYNVVFGALGAVAVFLFWVYLNASIMIFGAEVAAEYPRVRAGGRWRLPGVSEPLRATRVGAGERRCSSATHPQTVVATDRRRLVGEARRAR